MAHYECDRTWEFVAIYCFVCVVCIKCAVEVRKNAEWISTKFGTGVYIKIVSMNLICSAYTTCYNMYIT
jgi:hypothetical protein